MTSFEIVIVNSLKLELTFPVIGTNNASVVNYYYDV